MIRSGPCAAMALTLCGCLGGPRPYAHDPLLRDGSGAWGDPAAPLVGLPLEEPEPPLPPYPSDLPTGEWENRYHFTGWPAGTLPVSETSADRQ